MYMAISPQLQPAHHFHAVGVGSWTLDCMGSWRESHSNLGSTEAAPFQLSVSACSRCSPSLASSSAALGWGQDWG